MTTRERVLLGIIAALVVGGAVWFGVRGTASGADDPYADPQARGTITLYDASGAVETHGRIDTHPFAARAVSSIPAPPPYDVAGATATLVAYQPRKGVSASLWSGDFMAASTRYADPAHPAATATAADFSLADFIGEFPPRWNGAIELRIYFGAPGQPTLNTTYPAAGIKVTGDTWTLVPQGGGAS